MVMLGQPNKAVGGCCCLLCLPLGLSSKASGEPPSASSQNRKSDPAVAAWLLQVCKKLHMGITSISKKCLDIQTFTSSSQQLEKKKKGLWKCWKNCRRWRIDSFPGCCKCCWVGAGKLFHQLHGRWAGQNTLMSLNCSPSWWLLFPKSCSQIPLREISLSHTAPG